MAKPLTKDIILEGLKNLPPLEQIDTYADIKAFMDEQQAERQRLTEGYNKVENGK